MKTTIYIFVLLSVFFERASAQTSSDRGWLWQYPKPQGGTLNDFFVCRDDTAIGVGDLGTVMKTTDGGRSWDVQHHAGGTSYNLYGVHFTDSMNGWAAGGIRNSQKTVLLKSNDGGKSWTEIPTDTSLCYNAVYFVDADTGFVVGEDGILLRTTDGGRSWDTRMIDDYLAYGWLDVFNLYAVTFTDTQTGWIVGAGYYGNQIYKTTDCGRTWAWNDQIIQPRVYSSLYDICFTDKNIAFIVGDEGVFLKSTDGGATWQYQNLWEKYQKVEYQYFNSLCFTDSLTGWIAGGEYYAFILKTTDGGATWVEEGSSDIVGHFYKVRFSSTPPRNVGWIIGTEGMLLRTTDAGVDWVSQREKTYWFRSIHFIDDNIGWAVGDSGIILHSTDGGDNWQKQDEADSIILSSVYAIDSQNVFAVGSLIKGGSILDRNGIIFRTTTGGLAWVRQTCDSLYGFSSITFSSDSTGWISASNGTLLKTTDRGDAWLKVPLDSGGLKTGGRIQFVNKSIGWVAGMLKTTDGGIHWEAQALPSLSGASPYFADADVGWLVGDATGDMNVYKTTDGGKSWDPIGRTYPGYNFAIRFANQTTGWIAGYNYSLQKSILKTTDGGSTWIGQNIPSKSLTDIFFSNDNTGWVVGDGIFKTTNGGGVVSVKAGENGRSMISRQIQLFQNHPNPFNPNTVIEYRLSKSGFVSLTVYDILGRVVNTLVDRWEQEGEYKVVLEANNLPSGVYFYRLRAGGLSEVKKMILIR